MQLKLNGLRSQRDNFKKKTLKMFVYSLVVLFCLFLIDKFDFPSPKKDIKKNINNEIIKLK